MHQAKRYSFLHCIEHLAKAGKTDDLFHALEQKPFLADQAAHLGSFRQGAEDLLSSALPLAVRCEDWNRFLRLALRALNLGRLSRSLASPEVLRALASSGWLSLAVDVAAEQPEAADRIRARAVLAGQIRDENVRCTLFAAIEEDLQNLVFPPDHDDMAPLAQILEFIAREIAPRDWPGGEGMLAPLQAWPERADRVWIAAAEGCLRRSGLTDDALWEAFQRVRNPDGLRALLPFPLADTPGELAPHDLKRHLPDLPSGIFWLTSFALLGRQARRNPEDAVLSFETLSEEASIPWSAELIETGWDLFRALGPERIRRLAEGIPDAVSQAALWTLCLEDGGDPATARLAFESIQRLPAGPDQRHWSLRYLRADRVSPRDQIRRYTEGARLFLLQTGYAASPQDSALYLEQIAEVLPERCADEIQNVVGHLSSLSALEELAAAITSQRLLAELHERAEELAAIVARGEPEAARAVSRLLASLAARLCVERGDLLYLRTTSLRLPPSEEDEIRITVGGQLHRAGKLALAEEAVAGIRSSAARRTALLDLWPERAESLFREPTSLYAAFAHAEAIEDERLGLAALHASPVDLESVADSWLREMTPGPTATAAVLREARHALAFQNANGKEKHDALTILHFVERSLTAGSLSRSAAWLPAVVELGASLGSHRLLPELRAAAAELLTRPWEETREIFEDLLFRLRTSLPTPQRARALLVLFRSLGEIPDTECRRERTLQLLPLLAATAEQIPNKLVQRMFRQAGARAFEEIPSPSPEGFIAQVCAADSARRIEAAEAFLRSQDTIVWGGPFHALALLVSQTAPETAVALIRRTPPDDLRDDSCRRLIRYGWLPPLQVRELLEVITQPAPALEAGLFLEEGAGPWLQILARLATSHGFEPSAPGSSPILDRLWQIDPCLSRPCLADAVVTAIRSGLEDGERAIRLWLHAHLPPRLGVAQAERLHESEEAARSLREALALAAPVAAQQPVSLPDSTPSPAELGQMAGWLLRWKHTRAQTALWAFRREKTWTIPHALLMAAICFVLADFELDFRITETWNGLSRLLIIPFRLLVWTHTSPAWMAVLAIFPLNALLLHRFLELETPREDLRSWVLKLRFLLAGLPLLGLYVVPAWQRILQSQPSWAFRRKRSGILDDSGTQPFVSRRFFSAPGSWLDRLQSSPRFLFFWLWIVNLVAVRLATSRLSAYDVLPPDLRLTADGILHLAGFATTAALLRARFRNHHVTAKDRKFFWILAGTWVFPFPIPLLALSAPACAWFRQQTTGTLTTGTQSTGSPPEWALLLKLLREHAHKIPLRQRPWGLELPQRTGLVQQKFLSLCRAKTLLLIPDSILLTLVLWGVAHEDTRGTGIRILAVFLLAGFVLGALFLQLAGWVTWRISGLRRLVESAELGDSNEPYPYVRALTVTTAATLAGVHLGFSLGYKDQGSVGFSLILIGTVGIVARILPELKLGSVGPSLKEFFRSLISRQLLFLAIGYLGLQALQREQQARTIMDGLCLAALLSPLWALGLGLLGQARLLHPFKVRQLVSTRLPLQTRLVFAFCLLTLAVPLGGLAIPFWIWARQRLWPAWERELLMTTGDRS